MEYLGEEATAFPLSLSLEEKGFRLDGLEMGIATGEEGLNSDFDVVATNGEPTGLDGDPYSDFGSGEFGPLGNVLVEDKLNVCLVGLTTLAFFFDPLGIGGEGRAVASVGTEEAIGSVAGGRVGKVSLLARLDTVGTTLGAFSDFSWKKHRHRFAPSLLV